MKIELEIPPEAKGKRLDQSLVDLLPEYSRSRIQQWIKAGQVSVDGHQLKPKSPVTGGETVEIQAEEQVEVQSQPEEMPLNILYRDDHLIVIDKPASLVVHPGAGNPAGTLLNGLLWHFPELESIPRAGIVHRLDKNTTGLLVVARSLQAHHGLVKQLQARDMGRQYEAVVQGVMVAGGTVDASIARHSVDRKKMAVMGRGKSAVTHYRVLEKFSHHTHIRVQLETGRTHQIRVHLSHINYPIVGDPVYAGRMRVPAGASQQLMDALKNFPRQALHAAELKLQHPVSGEEMGWESPLPQDMQDLIAVLKASGDE